MAASKSSCLTGNGFSPSDLLDKLTDDLFRAAELVLPPFLTQSIASLNKSMVSRSVRESLHIPWFRMQYSFWYPSKSPKSWFRFLGSAGFRSTFLTYWANSGNFKISFNTNCMTLSTLSPCRKGACTQSIKTKLAFAAF